VTKGLEGLGGAQRQETMPGVIMENGGRSGAHTNHDRDQRPNGITMTSHGSERIQDKGKGREEPLQNVTPTSPVLSNGLHGVAEKILQNQNNYEVPKDIQNQISQLPPEIIHITQGYMSLKTLLARQSQKTHHNLLATINELAQMPGPASSANGNSAHTTSLDDNSPENINKKLRLLKFATDQHEAWTKTLVITGWSRRADDVSKIIDLKCHLDTQRQYYEEAIAHMSTLAKNLFHARLPNPDLKTALEVLTTGQASWMPDVSSKSAIAVEIY
jgi:mediator of RNA polymerase II transcription subunit 14